MPNEIIAAIIGAVATIIAALISAYAALRAASKPNGGITTVALPHSPRQRNWRVLAGICGGIALFLAGISTALLSQGLISNKQTATPTPFVVTATPPATPTTNYASTTAAATTVPLTQTPTSTTIPFTETAIPTIIPATQPPTSTIIPATATTTPTIIPPTPTPTIIPPTPTTAPPPGIGGFVTLKKDVTLRLTDAGINTCINGQVLYWTFILENKSHFDVITDVANLQENDNLGHSFAFWRGCYNHGVDLPRAVAKGQTVSADYDFRTDTLPGNAAYVEFHATIADAPVTFRYPLNP